MKQGTDGWVNDLRKIANELRLNVTLDDLEPVNILELSESIIEYNRVWFNDLCNSSVKLRTYRLFKDNNEEEPYLKMFLPRSIRSGLSQFRLGVFPLRIETGRYKREKLEDRICIFCDNEEVETEFHFLLKCDLYKNERQTLIKKVAELKGDINELNDDELFVTLLRDFPKQTAYYLNKARNIRHILTHK
jgi:hypothetical protein